MKIELSIEQLEGLLVQQKRITIEACMRHSYHYNLESVAGEAKNLPIDEEKFFEQGMKSSYPTDFIVLKRYMPK